MDAQVSWHPKSSTRHATMFEFVFKYQSVYVTWTPEPTLYQLPQPTFYELIQKKAEVGLTGENIQSMRFTDLTPLLREPNVVEAAKQFFRSLNKLCVTRHGNQGLVTATGETGSISANSTVFLLGKRKINVRVLLAAYMIYYFPANVFETLDGEFETTLLNSCKEFLEKVDAITNSVISSETKSFSDVPASLTVDYDVTLHKYTVDFKNWKIPDEQRLVSRIKHAIVALHQARSHLPPDEPANSPLLVEFDTQTTRLKEKLRNIAGGNALAALEEQIRISDETPGSIQSLPTVDRTILNTLVANISAGRLTNEELNHEIYLDEHFQIPEVEQDHTIMLTAIKNELTRLPTPIFTLASRILSGIRDAILQTIGDVPSNINMSSIIDQIETRKPLFVSGDSNPWPTFWKQLLHAMHNEVTTSLFERRRANAIKLWEPINAKIEEAGDNNTAVDAFCNAIGFFMSRICETSTDTANHRISRIQPVIENFGVTYEQEKFDQRISSGVFKLDTTKSWIEGIFPNGAEYTDLAIKEAIFELVKRPEPTTKDNTPVTLHLDVKNLLSLQNSLKNLAAAMCLLIKSKDMFSGDTIDFFTALCNAVSSNPGQCVKKTATETIDNSKLPISQSVRSMFKGELIPDCYEEGDFFYAMPLAQATEMWHNILTNGQPYSDMSAPDGFPLAGLLLIPCINKLGVRLQKIAQMNLLVHTNTYQRIHAEISANAVPDAAPASVPDAVDLLD